MPPREHLLAAAESALRRARTALLDFDSLLNELRPKDLKDYIEETHKTTQAVSAMLIALKGDCE